PDTNADTSPPGLRVELVIPPSPAAVKHFPPPRRPARPRPTQGRVVRARRHRSRSHASVAAHSPARTATADCIWSTPTTSPLHSHPTHLTSWRRVRVETWY